MVIYVDLDRTIFDIDSQFEDPENFTNNDFWKLANKEGFFENLPLLPWAKQLMAYLTDLDVELRILTATGHQHDRVALEKINSIKKNFPQFPIANIITLVSGKNKYIYARPGDLLIDDTKEVLKNWEEAGGIPVLANKNVIANLAEKLTC
jgi:5'(3')-deoxyribonucleotidase